MISDRMAVGVLLGALPSNAMQELVRERGIRPTNLVVKHGGLLTQEGRGEIVIHVFISETKIHDPLGALFIMRVSDWEQVEYEGYRAGMEGRQYRRPLCGGSWKIEILSERASGGVVSVTGTFRSFDEARVRRILGKRDEALRRREQDRLLQEIAET